MVEYGVEREGITLEMPGPKSIKDKRIISVVFSLIKGAELDTAARELNKVAPALTLTESSVVLPGRNQSCNQPCNRSKLDLLVGERFVLICK